MVAVVNGSAAAREVHLFGWDALARDPAQCERLVIYLFSFSFFLSFSLSFFLSFFLSSAKIVRSDFLPFDERIVCASASFCTQVYFKSFSHRCDKPYDYHFIWWRLMRSGAMLRGGDTSALPPTGTNLDLQGRVELYESWRSGFAEPSACLPSWCVCRKILRMFTWASFHYLIS